MSDHIAHIHTTTLALMGGTSCIQSFAGGVPHLWPWSHLVLALLAGEVQVSAGVIIRPHLRYLKPIKTLQLYPCPTGVLRLGHCRCNGIYNPLLLSWKACLDLGY